MSEKRVYRKSKQRYFTNSVWSKCGTKAQLEEQIGNGFKLKEGWLETDNDTILVVEKVSFGNDEPVYDLYYWDYPEVRAHMARILGFPVYRS